MSPPQRPSARLAALQHRDFRLLWYGQLISTTGSQMQLIAVNWQVYELLKGTSTTLTLWGHALHLNAGALGLGGLGLARVLPILFFAMVGGVLADTYSRRRLLILTQCASALLSALLAALTFSGHATVTTIYLLTAALSAVLALDGPARESLVPNVVPRAHLTNAVSLNMLLRVLGTIIGPALAGLMVAYTTIGLVYSVNALSFLAALITLVMMHYRGGVAVKRTAAGWRALVEGIRFTYGSRMIWSTMLLDFFATFFSSARTMLPIVADQVLHVGPSGYGLLATAQPVGAVLAGAITSLRREIHRQGFVLLVSVALYGLATALFGLAGVFALSYVLFALTGAADTVSSVIRGTIRQLLTPDHLRGRMVGVNTIFFMGGPQLGELEAGLVASLFGVPLAIFTGGVATVLLTAWVAWRYPRLRRYTSDMEKEYALAHGVVD